MDRLTSRLRTGCTLRWIQWYRRGGLPTLKTCLPTFSADYKYDNLQLFQGKRFITTKNEGTCDWVAALIC